MSLGEWLEEMNRLADSVGYEVSELRRYRGPEGERAVLGRLCGGGSMELMDFPVGRRGEAWPVDRVPANGLSLGVLLDEYVHRPLYCGEVPMHREGVEGSLEDDVARLFDRIWVEG